VQARSRLRPSRLINQRGRDARIIDWLDEITADCPKKSVHNMNDQCGARCPDLPRRLGPYWTNVNLLKLFAEAHSSIFSASNLHIAGLSVLPVDDLSSPR